MGVRWNSAFSSFLPSVPTRSPPTSIGARHSSSPSSPVRSERTLPVVYRLRRGRYDLAILLPNSFRSALTARLAGIPRRVGYARGGRGWLLTDRLEPPRDSHGCFVPVPAVEYYLNLARQVGCRPDSPQLELFTTATDEAGADRVWRALGIPAEQPVVTLNTGGAFGPAKSWPVASVPACAPAQSARSSSSAICRAGRRSSTR